MANHGALVFHKDPVETARLLATLGEAAELVIQAKVLGGVQGLPTAAIDAVLERMHTFGSHR